MRVLDLELAVAAHEKEGVEGAVPFIPPPLERQSYKKIKKKKQI